MKAIRLTNLGNLTLQNMFGLDKRYRENAGLKRDKLAKLWGSKEQMEAFEYLFSSYHGIEVIPIIEKNKENYFRFPEFNEDFKLGKAYSDAIKRFEEMGLVKFSKYDSLGELVRFIREDKETNPAAGIKDSTVELTGLCNLACKHCYRGGSREGEYGLEVDKIKEELRPLLRAGIRGIAFTGGESTLRKEDMLEIIDYAAQFLELKGVSVQEKMKYDFGKSKPTIKDVLKTKRFREMRNKMMAQLKLPHEEIKAGEWAIWNEHSEKDVEKILRSVAKETIEYTKKPSYFGLDHISILTNGFFEGQRELVKRLKSYGNISMQTSLDSFSEAKTDENRGRKGVFKKVKSLAKICREENFKLSITGHGLGKNSKKTKKNEEYFNQSSILVLEGMLQLGNAIRGNFKTADTNSKNNYIGALDPSKKYGDGWCGGFTTPAGITIRSTGNIGNCLYAYALEEEFGNLKNEPIADIINNIQNTRVYQMFYDGSIEKYQNELDKSLFDSEFSRSCEPMILTLTYGLLREKFKKQGVRYYRKQANQEVARIYKFEKEKKKIQRKIKINLQERVVA